MKKNIILSLTGLALSVAIISSCGRDEAPAPAPKNYSWTEDFDSLQSAFRKGWVAINNSKPYGEQTWTNIFDAFDPNIGKKGGYTNPITAQSYTYSGSDFAMATYYSVGADTTGFLGKKPTISNWLISPVTVIKNGDKITFYSRTLKNPADVADRLQVRLNPVSSSANVGADTSSVGDFTQLLLDINPRLRTTLPAGGNPTIDVYPGEWTKYEITIRGLSAPLERRFAFRYYVPNAGASGVNGLVVGIDKVEFISQ